MIDILLIAIVYNHICNGVYFVIYNYIYIYIYIY